MCFISGSSDGPHDGVSPSGLGKAAETPPVEGVTHARPRPICFRHKSGLAWTTYTYIEKRWNIIQMHR